MHMGTEAASTPLAAEPTALIGRAAPVQLGAVPLPDSLRSGI